MNDSMSIPKPLKRTLPSALLGAALALSTGTASAQADNLEGALERGATHSVLWFASPETGDLIGQAFANIRRPARPSWHAACPT